MKIRILPIVLPQSLGCGQLFFHQVESLIGQLARRDLCLPYR